VTDSRGELRGGPNFPAPKFREGRPALVRGNRKKGSLDFSNRTTKCQEKGQGRCEGKSKVIKGGSRRGIKIFL